MVMMSCSLTKSRNHLLYPTTGHILLMNLTKDYKKCIRAFNPDVVGIIIHSSGRY